jgi:HrpA-like RNA helicase
MLLATPAFRADPHRRWVLPLHSGVPPEDQRQCFLRPPKGVRKIVLATNM